MPSMAQEARRIGRTRPEVRIDGNSLSPETAHALKSLRIEHGYGLPGRATLRFHDVGMTLANARTFEIGKKVEVSPGDSAQSAGPLFTGQVTAVEFDMRSGGSGARSVGELVVTVDDAAAKLAWSTDTKAALNQSGVDVINALAKAHDVKVQVAGSLQGGEYHLQRGTALEVVNDLTRRNGAVWWTDGKGQLHVAPAAATSGSVTVTYGDQDLLGFSLRANSRNPDTVEVTGWDPAQQKAIVATSKPTASSNHRPFGKLDAWQSKVAVGDLQPVDERQARVIADGLRAESVAAAVVMTATCLFNPALAPHVELVFKGAGDSLDGSYVLTHVEHVYTPDGFETRVTSGPLRPTGLVDLLGPRATGFEALGRSVVPAVVTNVADPQKKAGRVKVKFPALDQNTESAWARLVTLGAGKDRGMVFYPEVGDEVLVAFENGDINHPVVLGGLHSDRNTFNFGELIKGNEVSTRRITSKKGHTLEFADGTSDTEQHVKLTSKNGEHLIRLGNDKLEIQVGNVPVTIKNGAGAEIEFSNSGDVTISGKNVTIKSTGAVKIEGTSEVAIKSTGPLKEEGAMVEIKAQGMGKFEASGPMAVKGATVMIN